MEDDADLSRGGPEEVKTLPRERRAGPTAIPAESTVEVEVSEVNQGEKEERATGDHEAPEAAPVGEAEASPKPAWH